MVLSDSSFPVSEKTSKEFAMLFSDLILESAQEGIVLLRNTEQTLPLMHGDKVSVFGRMQYDFYRSGTGSGGSVHIPYSTNFTDSLIESAEQIGFELNTELSALYHQFIIDNPFDNGGGEWAGEPWSQKELELDDEIVKSAALHSNKAIVVIGRNSGEDKDFLREKGSYFLTDIEYSNLKKICGAFQNVIIVFNTSGIIDTAWIDSPDLHGHIKSVLYAWQGGQEAGRSCATIVSGTAVPSGKLTDTIARSIDDYPSTKNFGAEKNFYAEDIYVGYRYFNTFAKEAILFPFGYGLSYTSFSLEKISAAFRKEDMSLAVRVTVTNTGRNWAGKEIVQLYLSAPQGKLGKPLRELAAFAKTKELAPGSSQELILTCCLKDFASYDDSGATGNQFAHVLEKGLYKFYLGTDSLSAEQISIESTSGIELEETLVVERLEQCAAPTVSFERMKCSCDSNGKPVMSFEKVPLSKTDMAQRIQANIPSPLSKAPSALVTFDDVKDNPSLLDSFIAQLSLKELCTMVRGEGMLSQKVTPGIAAAFGGLSQTLHDTYRIPCAGCADGPSGLRLDTGGEASLLPSGTQLACTWNPDLVQKLYTEEGKELAVHKVDTLLGPGMNIHRNPLNGRNFEYFSEDPLLSAEIAKAEVAGLKEGGSNATIKHLAVNSQETFRRTTDSIVSERALREIYLKPFELTVKAGVVKSIMTSYNAINGHWAASNYDVVNTILHKEWGYTGLVMSDWWADMNDCVKGGTESIKNLSSMIRARNDIYMVVDNDGAEDNLFGDNLEQSISEGSLTLGELQLCVKDILGFILQAPVSRRNLGPLKDTAVFECLNLTVSGNTPTCDIEFNKDFIPSDKTVYTVTVSGETDVSVVGLINKTGDDLSQSASNIFINQKPGASFECRTTFGKDQRVTAAKIKLLPGTHTVKLEHTKPGITIKSLAFITEEYSPVMRGVFK